MLELIIYVVNRGDSLYSIGRKYGVSPYTIAIDNQIENADLIAVGQALVIEEGARRHTVAPGQSIYTIARIYGVTVGDIVAANPGITDPSLIYPGITLTIPKKEQKLGVMEVNGYAFASTNLDIIRRTLPNLTFISIFSKPVNPDGSLQSINDAPIIQAARTGGVGPFMVITNISQKGGFSSDLAHTILTDDKLIDTLLNNVISELKSKNYYGLDIDFEYIYPEDRENYNNFLGKAVSRVKSQGYPVSTALAPKVSAAQKGLLYEAHDYPVHGQLADHVILMTYEWGFTYGPPMAVAPVNSVKKVLDYAVTAIPSSKILMGVPNYGYDWTLPYKEGTAAQPLSNPSAANNAAKLGAEIKFDNTAMSPYYNYYDKDGKEHVVWFEDARSIDAKLKLVNEYKLGGASYWTIGRYFSQNWLVLDSLYNVRTVL